MKRTLLVMFVLALAVAAVLWQDEPISAPQGSGVAAPAVAPPASASAVPGAAAPPPARSEAPVVRAVEPARDPVVRMRLLQDRRPLAGIEVSVMAHEPDAYVELWRVTTAADGTFAFPSTRLVWLAAPAPEVPRGWTVNWIAPSPVDVDRGDVHVPRGAVIEGVVRGAQQQLLVGARVSVAGNQSGRRFKNEFDDAAVLTDAAGRFRIARVHPGNNRVQAAAAGHAPAFVDVEAAAGELVRTELALNAGDRITGRVFDWRREPLCGAVVSSEGAQTETGADGTFVFDAYGGRELAISAPGHDRWFAKSVAPGTHLEQQLDRVVALRGVVKGHRGRPSSVRLEKSAEDAAIAQEGVKESSHGTTLRVAADGTFMADRLAPADYWLIARAEGVGVSPVLRVEVRDDAAVELAIAPAPVMQLVVRDEQGQPVGGGEVTAMRPDRDLGSLCRDGDPDLGRRILESHLKIRVPLDGARASLSLVEERPIAFVVQVPGFLPLARGFSPGSAPAQLDVVLQRAGSVRGIVRGGDAKVYARTVLLWRAADDERMRTPYKPDSGAAAFTPRHCTVDAAGGFYADAVEPGSWYALLSRGSGSRVGNRPDEQVGAVPLIEEDLALDRRVRVEVVAGVETLLDLVDPPLGVLRGRVLLAGEPFAGAKIVATRPGWQPRSWRREHADWDDKLQLGWVPGQHTGADGTFTFLYRDAGDVELRVRHPNGAATSSPTIVSLPPPGAPVLRDIVMPGGGIRGRLPAAMVTERNRSLVAIVLFPMRKAALDPFVGGDWDAGVQWGCSRMDLPADGAFTFPFLSAGDWLVRIYEQGFSLGKSSFNGRIYWQRVIAVRDAVVDLGELTLPQVVTARFGWQWEQPDGAPKGVDAVGLFQAHGGDQAAVWVHRFSLHEQDIPRFGIHARIASVPAGDYVLAPISYRWREGEAIAVKVAPDGTVTPSVVTFPPASSEPR